MAAQPWLFSLLSWAQTISYYLDLYQMHEWDGLTPLEETLDALDTLVRSGKVRYVGCFNYAGWQLMKAIGLFERMGLQRYVSEQLYYSLQARDAEYELVPLAAVRYIAHKQPAGWL